MISTEALEDIKLPEVMAALAMAITVNQPEYRSVPREVAEDPGLLDEYRRARWHLIAQMKRFTADNFHSLVFVLRGALRESGQQFHRSNVSRRRERDRRRKAPHKG